MKLLIIDADNRVAADLHAVVGRKDWEIERAASAEDGLAKVEAPCDFVVINNLLPDRTGLELLSELRQKDDSLPVVMYSGQCPVEERIAAFAVGVDDYLQKPFQAEELAARIEAIRRRVNKRPVENLFYGDLELCRQSFELICGEERVYLSMKEFQVLELLLSSAGQVVERSAFLQKIWGHNNQAEYNSVEVYISFVRKKIEQIGSRARIKTVRGVGYSLLFE